MNDDNNNSEPSSAREVERETGEAQGSAEGVVVHLNEIVEQANKDKRSIDQMLQDKRPWAQINPSRQMQERLNSLLRSWHDQNSEMLSALTPLVTDNMGAALADIGSRIQVNFDSEALSTALASFATAQSEVVSQALNNAFGALHETSRSLSTLESLRNRPGYATSTQRFLATTEDLRYGSGRTVWHYTRGSVLMEVLSKHYLWASIPHNLNDSSEVTHGLAIIKKAFREALDRIDADPDAVEAEGVACHQAVEQVLNEEFFKDVLNEIYIISASVDPDSLTLWRNYSGGDGFAIGINSGTTLSADGIAESPEAREAEAKDGIPPIGGWYKVHYSDKRKKDLAERFVADAIEDIKKAAPSNRRKLTKEQRKHILILASTMKHKAFKDEKEVRWMTTNWMPVDIMPHGSVVHYEHTPRGIVPVLHVEAASEGNNAHLPIRGIRCSPASPAGIERTIEGLLNQRGYKEASRYVKQSKQPYKG